MEFDAERMLNRRLSIAEGALQPWSRMPTTDSWYGKVVEAVAKRQGFKTDVPLEKLEQKHIDYLLYTQRAPRLVPSDFVGAATTTPLPSKPNCCVNVW